jgi:hypothetical protein
MGLHTARLIFTIIFLIFALSGLVAGYWVQAIVWVLIAFAVGYPFVRNGRIDLYYEDAPTQVFILEGQWSPQAMQTEVPITGPMTVQGAENAPPMLQQLFQGNVGAQ